MLENNLTYPGIGIKWIKATMILGGFLKGVFMLTTVRNIRQMILKNKLAAIIASIPKLSATEQTILSWAKPIRSFEDVPAIYQDFFKSYLTDEQPFPYSVLTPTYEGFLRRAAEKLIGIFGNAIVILERKGHSVESQSYPIDTISYVEMGTALLDAYLKICGLTDYGIPAASILRFNTVTDYLFTPILNSIRPKPLYAKDIALELEKFNQWVSVNFKFMNYARRSLLEGEKVVHTVLQPEIRAGRFTIFGKTYTRIVSPTQVCILTDSELILIREELRLNGDDRYGGIWDYIPLNKIGGLSLNEKEDGLLALTVHLPENERLECVFQESLKREASQLVERFSD
jgi:hypothetical protein